jgi:hypothetical protein
MLIKWNIESDIVFLIKTMKKKHLSDVLTKGEICFSYPETFANNITNLNAAQIDTWDSHHFFPAENIYCYPVIEDNENGIKYGSGIKLADKATLREINEINKHTPFCCFRKVTIDEITERDGLLIFSLGDIVDRIKQEFGHDSFVLILRPDVFLNRIGKDHSCYGKSIIYGELCLEDKKEFEENEKAGFPQIKMYQKRDTYAWQKEYRVILTPTEDTERHNIYIGSIEDIAIGGDIEHLRLGYAFGKSIEELQKDKGE